MLLRSALLLLSVEAGWQVASRSGTDILEVGLFSNTGAYATGYDLYNGDQILKTDDLGKSWQVSKQFDMDDDVFVFSCAALDSKRGMASTIDGEGFYTIDGGVTWSKTEGIVVPYGDLCMAAKSGDFYGCVGQENLGTSDDGSKFDHFDIPGVVDGRFITWGSFVSKDIWYASAGSFPDFPPGFDYGLKKGEKLMRRMSARRFIKRTAKGKLAWHKVARTNATKALTLLAEVFKTEDGGKSFEKVVAIENRLFFNGIDCCDASLCYAIGEGLDFDDSDKPGAYIYRTEDGGKSWKEVYHKAQDNNDEMFIQQVTCTSKKEAWVAANFFQRNDEEGHFIRTVDGGDNWAQADKLTTQASLFWMAMTPTGDAGIATGIDFDNFEEPTVVFNYTPDKFNKTSVLY